MKKVLIALNSLQLGGIEKAGIMLLNYLVENGYEVTVLLEQKKGIYLKELNNKIKIIEYTPSENSNIIIRKIVNMLKRIKFILKNKNKFDFSASFATYSLVCSFVARVASKNSALWGHADYLELFKEEEKMKKFFEQLNYNDFKHLIFVSKEGRDSFIKLFPDMKSKTFECNNLIDGKKIEELALEKITDVNKEEFTFVNIGRHDEVQKKVTRIIEAAEKLKEDKIKFKILLIGDGEDTNLYKKLINEKELNDDITLLGRKENPYPYFKIADCVLLSSDYEGYPVVFLESYILNKPIITTDISGSDSIEGKYGYVVGKNSEELYNKMKKMIEDGYKIKEKFNYEEYNKNIVKKLNKII